VQKSLILRHSRTHVLPRYPWRMAGQAAYVPLCPLSAACCLLSAVCCLLSAVCCLLSTVCCPLSAVCIVTVVVKAPHDCMHQFAE
jgi:hypothetical protein